MKASVALLAVFLTLCQSTPGWEDGKEYLYEFEGKFGTGISDNVLTQAAGRGIRGYVRVRHQNNELSVKFDQLRGAEFNKQLTNVWEVVELDYQKPGEKEKSFVEQLEKTFWAEYNNGVITASKHSGNASPSDINPKRALLSLLQVSFPTDKPHDHFYTVKETSIGGDCDTTYAIIHAPHDENSGAEVINITKNYLYDRCTYEPHLFFSSLDGYKCTHCKEENFRRYRATGRVDYNIRGNRNNYTIERIIATGVIAYSPFTINGQTILSITNQTLRLIDIVPATLPASPNDAKRIEGLYYKFNIELFDLVHPDLKQNIAANKVFKTLPQYSNEKITRLLKNLEPETNYHSFAENTALLGQILYTFSYDDWKQFFDNHVNLDSKFASPVEKDRRNFLFQILAFIGTNPSIVFALELIKDGKVPEKIMEKMLYTIPFHAKTPTESLLDAYLEFMKLSEDPESFKHSIGWLSYGTLVYKACIKHDFNPHPPRRQTYASSERCQTYVHEIINMINETSSSKGKCILIRSLKNTRSEEAFQFLAKEVIPNNRKYNAYIRAAAIWGLEHYVTHHTQEIVKILVSILIDTREDYQLRIYAYDILMLTSERAALYSDLVFLMNQDPSEQLSSYIYSSFVSYANSTDPCYQHIARYSRSVLPYMKKRNWDVLRHSTNKIFSFYNEKYGFGRTTQFSFMGSNNTLTPRALFLRMAVNFHGYNFDVIEVGAIQRNKIEIDSMIALLLGQYSLMYSPKFREENYHLAKHYDLLEILAKQGAELYVRQFNQDSAIIHSLQTNGEDPFVTKIGENLQEIHYTKIINCIQVEYTVTNLLGLPTVLQFQVPLISKLDGTIETVQQHTRAFASTGAELNISLHFGASLQVRGQVEVQTPLFGNYGFELKTDIGLKFPMVGDIDFDLKAKKTVIKKIVYADPFDIIYYKTQPYTFSHSEKYVPVIYAEKPIQRDYKFGHDYFGAGLKLSVSYDYRWNDYGSHQNFIRSFFHKSTRNEDYFDIIEKLYAGSTGFLQYVLFNPTAKPFELHLRFERSTVNPAETYTVTWDKEEELYYKPGEKQEFFEKKTGIELIAMGAIERKWNFDFTIDRHYPVTDYRRVKFHFLRAPIPNYDSKPYEICATSEASIEGLKSIIENPIQPAKEAKIKYNAILNVGSDCGENSKQIKIKGEATKSEEQNFIDKDKLSIYQQCKEDYIKGYEYSYACWKVKEDQGRVDHFKFDIEYSSNINSKVKELLHVVYMWFRHTFYNNLQVDHHTTDVPENHVRIEANVSYRYPFVDMHVKRPKEYVHYHHIFIPSIIPRFEPITIIESIENRYLRKIFNYRRPTCYLSGDYIFTLDEVQYKYTLGACFHVAVANCLSENVLLLYKKVNAGKFTKALKFVVDKYTVEIKPTDDKLVAFADEVLIEDDQLTHLKDDEFGITYYSISKKFIGYEIVSPIAGLKVYFDGRNSLITISNLYRGRQCGLCGDFNGEQLHEFKAVDGTLHKDGASFAQSYAIHEDECYQA